MYNIIKEKIPGQLVFDWDTITPIKHIAVWRFTCHSKQVQIEKYVILKRQTKINYNFKVGDKVLMINIKQHINNNAIEISGQN